jgi:hypothetical protein
MHDLQGIQLVNTRVPASFEAKATAYRASRKSAMAAPVRPQPHGAAPVSRQPSQQDLAQINAMYRQMAQNGYFMRGAHNGLSPEQQDRAIAWGHAMRAAGYVKDPSQGIRPFALGTGTAAPSHAGYEDKMKQTAARQQLARNAARLKQEIDYHKSPAGLAADTAADFHNPHYLQDVGKVFQGYGNALNPVNIGRGVVGLGEIAKDQGIGAAGHALADGTVHALTDWTNTDDPEKFGESFMNTLLTVAPGMKRLPMGVAEDIGTGARAAGEGVLEAHPSPPARPSPVAAKGVGAVNRPTGPVPGARLGGVIVRKVGDHYVKSVNPQASRVARAYARQTIKEQAEALKKLGDLAPPFQYSDGELIVQDVGRSPGLGDWLKGYVQGSNRLGTMFNDIWPKNMGANGQIFDPVLPPGLEDISQWIYNAGRFAGYGNRKR